MVHFAHTDFGYTDQPVVVRNRIATYVDIALDAALGNQIKAKGRSLLLDDRITVHIRGLVEKHIAGAPRSVR